MGAKQLADAKAIVKNLTDVETLGATSAINTDKTGTLTMNQMMVSVVYANGAWFTVEGEGYRKTGAITSVAGVPVPDFTNLALGMVLDSDATVADDGAVVGDPTEAALVVLVGQARRRRRRDAPKLPAARRGALRLRVQVHGDLPPRDARRARAGRAAGEGRSRRRPGAVCPFRRSAERDARPDRRRCGPTSTPPTSGWAEQGLRVLAFAARFVEDDELDAMRADPMSLTQDLDFVGMVGIIDPLRAEAKGAVHTALGAGIDVRMITGDHAVTAEAIGKELGLGPGAISGSELQALSDDELARRLPQLHVFGRVSPEDKLRLARVMQEQGLIVAMTGDAVNDAAALKQADIGVAMGSGSEVTKQAGRMILTDDNFGTLVNAVEIGRRVYEKIVSYVRYQMTQLLALVMLFIAATVFDVNEGVALTPLMVIYLLVFVTAAGVVIIALDPGDPDVMHRPPRDPKLPITNRTAVILWIVYGAVLAAAAFVPLVAGPDEPSTSSSDRVADHDVRGDGPRHRVQRARPTAAIPPAGSRRRSSPPSVVAIVPIALIFLATQLPSLQHGLLTTSLTGPQWLAAIGLALALPVVIEAGKWIRRRRAPEPADARRRASGRSRARRSRADRVRRRSTWPSIDGDHRHGQAHARDERQFRPNSPAEDEGEGVPARAAPAARRARRDAGMGQGARARRSASCSRAATRPARAGRSRRSPNA